jgi:branched-chain amino acid transport system permease protein
MSIWVLLLQGVGTGSVYALIGMSLNVIYGATSILNFAQGFWIVVAGLLAFRFVPAGGESVLAWLGWMVVVTVLVTLFTTVQGVLTLLPLRSSTEQHSWLVTTLAASVIIGGIVLVEQGGNAIIVPTVLGSLTAFSVTESFTYVLAPALCLCVLLALTLADRRTASGLALRAIRQDLEAARAAGLRVRALQIGAFAVSGVIVGLTGFLTGPVLGLSQSTGVTLVLYGFTAALMGGLGNNVGAVLGGVLLGLASVATGLWVGGDFQEPIVLLLLIAVLLVRPQGIVGRARVRRV